jgi:hypothetical protein
MSLFELLINRERYSFDMMASLRETFQSEHLVRLPEFFSRAAFDLLAAEVLRLSQLRRRREFFMEATGNSPRKMSTIGSSIIKKHSSILPLLYSDELLLSYLSAIAGERVYRAPDIYEDVVCNFLHDEGDTHGAHVDVYPFAFNLTIEAAERGKGGLLEIWPKQDSSGNPRLFHLLTRECYLLRSDRHMHSITPLARNQHRTVLNLAYANEETLNANSYSSSILYGHDD